MTLFSNWFKLPVGATRPHRLDTRDYHMARCAQELAMARKAGSAAAADAHARLALAHRQAADGSTASAGMECPQVALCQRPASRLHFDGPDAG